MIMCSTPSWLLMAPLAAFVGRSEVQRWAGATTLSLAMSAPVTGQSFYQVEVPAGVGPGMQFHANCGGQMVAVVVPDGVQPGQYVQIQVPSPVHQTLAAHPAPQPQVEPVDRGMPGYAEPQQLEITTGANAITAGERDDAENNPARWESVAGLVKAFKLSFCAIICGLLFVLIGKILQEFNRPLETTALWEVSLCCGSESSGQCERFVGYYDGPETICPVGSAAGTDQSFSLGLLDTALVAGRTYYMVFYVTTRSEVKFDFSLQDAAGRSLLARTTLDVTAVASRRRLLEAAASAEALVPLFTSVPAPTARSLLKGSSGGSSGTSGGGGGGTASTTGAAGGGGTSTARTTQYSTATSRSTYSRSTSSATSSARTYGASAVRTGYGRRSVAAFAAGSALGLTYRRRSSRSDTQHSQGGGEATAVEDPLDRAEVVSPSFVASSFQYPLELIAHSVEVTTGEKHDADDAPYVFFGLYSAASDTMLLAADAGVALWSIGAALVALPIIVNLGRFVIFIGSNRARMLRYHGTIIAWRSCMQFIALALFISGIAAASYGQNPSEAVGITCIVLSLVLCVVNCGIRQWPYPLMSTGVKGMEPGEESGPHCPAQRAMAHFALLLGLVVVCTGAVVTDVQGYPYMIVVGVGIIILCASSVFIWFDVKTEHVK